MCNQEELWGKALAVKVERYEVTPNTETLVIIITHYDDGTTTLAIQEDLV